MGRMKVMDGPRFVRATLGMVYAALNHASLTVGGARIDDESPVLVCVSRVAQALQDDYWEEANRQMQRLLAHPTAGARPLTDFESTALQMAHGMVERAAASLARIEGAQTPSLDGFKLVLLCLDSRQWVQAKDALLEATPEGRA